MGFNDIIEDTLAQSLFNQKYVNENTLKNNQEGGKSLKQVKQAESFENKYLVNHVMLNKMIEQNNNKPSNNVTSRNVDDTIPSIGFFEQLEYYGNFENKHEKGDTKNHVDSPPLARVRLSKQLHSILSEIQRLNYKQKDFFKRSKYKLNHQF